MSETPLVPRVDRQAVCPLCASHDTRRWNACRPEATILRCAGCGVDFAEYADTPARASRPADHFANVDREPYERSVKKTREASYETLWRRVSRHVARGAWLDVGCSYGWLLRDVAGRGFRAVGVEPSPSAVREAQGAGLEVRHGTYPDSLAPGETFEVISFMDVLEHMPDPRGVVRRTRSHLAPNGVVVVQVPDQSCMLYRLAGALCRVSQGRWAFALRRLWLVELDSPHRFYFTRPALERLFTQNGFTVLDCYRSAIGSPLQAFDRVGYLDRRGGVSATLVGAAVASINALDALSGHGGLLTLIARPAEAAS